MQILSAWRLRAHSWMVGSCRPWERASQPWMRMGSLETTKLSCRLRAVVFGWSAAFLRKGLRSFKISGRYNNTLWLNLHFAWDDSLMAVVYMRRSKEIFLIGIFFLVSSGSFLCKWFEELEERALADLIVRVASSLGIELLLTANRRSLLSYGFF